MFFHIPIFPKGALWHFSLQNTLSRSIWSPSLFPAALSVYDKHTESNKDTIKCILHSRSYTLLLNYHDLTRQANTRHISILFISYTSAFILDTANPKVHYYHDRDAVLAGACNKNSQFIDRFPLVVQLLQRFFSLFTRKFST